MITALDKNTALVLIDLQNSVVAVQTKPHTVEDVLKNTNELMQHFEKNNCRCFGKCKACRSMANIKKGS